MRKNLHGQEKSIHAVKKKRGAPRPFYSPGANYAIDGLHKAFVAVTRLGHNEERFVASASFLKLANRSV